MKLALQEHAQDGRGIKCPAARARLFLFCLAALSRALCAPLFLVVSLFQISAAAESPKQFLVISDIHFNPLADPAIAPQLVAAEASQWESILSADTKPPVQKYGDDSAWPLFAALVSGIQNVQPRPQVIILTGDVLAHKFQDKFAAAQQSGEFRSFVRKTFQFIGLELAKASGGIPIIYTLGNNDEECGDYALQPNGPFLQDTAQTVETLAHVAQEAMTDWSALGSYVTANPLAKHHRIIALNSNFWSRRYVNSCAAGQGDPGDGELVWLATQLKDAQQHGDKVWMAYHIPPGIDGHTSARSNDVVTMWKPQYAEGFNRLLDKYRETIQLNLAAHTHLDDIRLVKTEHTETLVLLNPAVSPNVGQNPAFRVVTVDAKARPKDILTYYIPDLAAMRWQLEYSARTAYGLKNIDAASYEALYRQVGESPEVSEKWKRFYSVSRLAGLADSKTYLQSLYCATGNSSAQDYKACLGLH